MCKQPEVVARALDDYLTEISTGEKLKNLLEVTNNGAACDSYSRLIVTMVGNLLDTVQYKAMDTFLSMYVQVKAPSVMEEIAAKRTASLITLTNDVLQDEEVKAKLTKEAEDVLNDFRRRQRAGGN